MSDVCTWPTCKCTAKGQCEGLGHRILAPTFTAADLQRAWEMGRDAGLERAERRWATRSEQASRLFEMDYPEAQIDSKCYSHRAGEADDIAYEIRALTTPADLTQRVKE